VAAPAPPQPTVLAPTHDPAIDLVVAQFLSTVAEWQMIVAGHDPLVADRFQQVEPGIIKIA